MLHDDGQHTEELEHADVVLTGVSRTSKTPTSIYLANRGVKTANVRWFPTCRCRRLRCTKSGVGPGCVKMHLRGEPIEWTFPGFAP